MRLFIQLVIAIAAIAQVSAEQRSDTILIQGNPAGSQRVQTDQAGVTQVEYSYNDRGRGDHITATWKLELTQYRITGLGFTPQAIWLDHDGNTAATVSSWFSVIQAPYQNAIPQLQEAQQAADDVWSGHLAHALAHVPKGDLVIRNARLFDPRDLSVTPGMSVLVRTGRIVRVAPDPEMNTAVCVQ